MKAYIIIMGKILYNYVLYEKWLILDISILYKLCAIYVKNIKSLVQLSHTVKTCIHSHQNNISCESIRYLFDILTV
jgi:hypothetical protein